MSANATIAGPARERQTIDVAYYQHERYLGRTGHSRPLSVYYALKPFVPRTVQRRLRRLYARRQATRRFPAWPIEPILVDGMHEDIRLRLEAADADVCPLVNFWPDRRDFAFILTHDVESAAGIENIPQVLEIERRHGFVSSWNFVAEWYPIPEGTFEQLRAAGCEIGLHGIKHDGKLFGTRAQFDANLPKIHDYLERWDAVGFRSPATHRNAEWMHELGCLYDSSFPDTDPFEPQPGGCCSILPFFFDDLVELPITLVQDHTLFEILRARSIDHWVHKSEWLIRNHGLVNLLTHPDYLDTPERLALYDEILGFLGRQASGWHALPREVAGWWRTREGLRCERVNGLDAMIVGDDAARATVAWARRLDDGEVVFEALTGAAPEARRDGPR